MSSTTEPDAVFVLEPGKKVWDVVSKISNQSERDEAFFVFDINDIIHKHDEWQRKMPRVSTFYAVKCNDNRTVLKVLASLGASFDCATMGEIAKVLSLGVEPDRIIYANPTKQLSHIKYSASVNVRKVTFDNEDELYKMKKIHPTAKLILRIRCDAKKALIHFGNKFGADPKEAASLMKLAKQLSLELVGISFHVGTGCEEPEVFERCFVIARELFDLATRDFGFTMTILDLGGGFPGHRESCIDQMATIINTSLDRYFPDGCGVDIIAEPGTYYVASAFTLATQIHSRRKLITYDNSQKIVNSSCFYYYINDGFYGSFLGKALPGNTKFTPLSLERQPGFDYISSIWGPTLDSMDCIVTNIPLPIMEIGDWLIFENMGDYSLSTATSFNSFPLPKIYPVVDEKIFRNLKERSTFNKEHFEIKELSAI